MDKLRFRDEGLTIDQIQSNNDLIIDSSYEIVYDSSIDIYTFKAIYDLLLSDDNLLFTTVFSMGTSLSFMIPTLYSNLSRSDKIKVDSYLEIEGVKINGEEINVFKSIQEFLNHNRVFSKEKVAE